MVEKLRTSVSGGPEHGPAMVVAAWLRTLPLGCQAGLATGDM